MFYKQRSEKTDGWTLLILSSCCLKLLVILRFFNSCCLFCLELEGTSKFKNIVSSFNEQVIEKLNCTVLFYSYLFNYLDYSSLLMVTTLKNSETNLPLCLLHRSQEPARLEWNMPEFWGTSQIKLFWEPARLSCERSLPD